MKDIQPIFMAIFQFENREKLFSGAFLRLMHEGIWIPGKEMKTFFTNISCTSKNLSIKNLSEDIELVGLEDNE